MQSTGTGISWQTATSSIVSGSTPITGGTSGGIVYNSSGTVATLSNGLSGQILTSSGSGVAPVWSSVSPYVNPNALFNSEFLVAQRIKPGDAISFTSSTTFATNNDATYLFDRWYLLYDGNNRVNVTRETSDVPARCASGCKFSVVATSAVGFKFGIAQILETANITGFKGGQALVSFKAKVSNNARLNDIRVALVGWTGASNTVTRDIVSSWNAAGANPTLVANATYLNTPQNLNVPSGWEVDGFGNSALYLTMASVPSNVNNLIVFIWSNATNLVASDFLTVTQVKLENSDYLTMYESQTYDGEFQKCLRYCYGMWATTVTMPYCSGHSDSDASILGAITFPHPMRTAPTVSFTPANTFKGYTTGSVPATSISTVRLYSTGYFWRISAAAGSFQPFGGGLMTDNGTTVPISALIFSSEL